jgi:hypothetical protein
MSVNVPAICPIVLLKSELNFLVLIAVDEVESIADE